MSSGSIATSMELIEPRFLGEKEFVKKDYSKFLSVFELFGSSISGHIFRFDGFIKQSNHSQCEVQSSDPHGRNRSCTYGKKEF